MSTETAADPVRPLTRKTPLRAKPRSKGNRAEREVIEIMHGCGWPKARRNFQSGGQGGSDIVEGPAGYAWEVKHHETVRMREWVKQAQAAASPTEIPVVVHRINRRPWQAVLPYLDLPRTPQEHISPRAFARWELWRWIDEATATLVEPVAVFGWGAQWANVSLLALLQWIWEAR